MDNKDYLRWRFGFQRSGEFHLDVSNGNVESGETGAAHHEHFVLVVLQQDRSQCSSARVIRSFPRCAHIARLIYNRKRVESDRSIGGFGRFVFRRSGALVGVYVGLVLAYGGLSLSKSWSVSKPLSVFSRAW